MNDSFLFHDIFLGDISQLIFSMFENFITRKNSEEKKTVRKKRFLKNAVIFNTAQRKNKNKKLGILAHDIHLTNESICV